MAHDQGQGSDDRVPVYLIPQNLIVLAMLLAKYSDLSCRIFSGAYTVREVLQGLHRDCHKAKQQREPQKHLTWQRHVSDRTWHHKRAALNGDRQSRVHADKPQPGVPSPCGLWFTVMSWAAVPIAWCCQWSRTSPPTLFLHLYNLWGLSGSLSADALEPAEGVQAGVWCSHRQNRAPFLLSPDEGEDCAGHGDICSLLFSRAIQVSPDF